ncbi:ead/Ea22-like family protein [Klebsiella pneumoniae]|uniref:ead/Ea22-like family protein n=1 Tax=Klebsiella pneumoniae TaxID=573 RepID=UPI0020300CCA|nr:ead/Ea22-like family protein [Klebsiella pneumoniae]MCM1594602.1 ead/Ea22-like family protein [Klebsiella pneumoniae]
MTDITELAQRLKASAEKATPGPWEVQFDDEIYATDGVDNEQVAIATLDARDADYIALANPANVLALVEALEKAQQRISQLESRTVKLPDGWQFEECEIEGCENGAIFSVGTGSRNIHLCDKCAHEPQNSRLKKSPLSKRLPFKMSAGIKVEAE